MYLFHAWFNSNAQVKHCEVYQQLSEVQEALPNLRLGYIVARSECLLSS